MTSDVTTAPLADRLRLVTNALPAAGVTLAALRDLVGEDGLMVLTAFLTLVFMVPVSIPGVSTVFGAGILLIGISRLFGQRLWLPSSVARRVVSSEKVRAAFDRGLVLFQRLERVSRPHRLRWLTARGVVGIVNDLGLILGAILLMMPFGLIPLSNTLPAIAILFFDRHAAARWRQHPARTRHERRHDGVLRAPHRRGRRTPPAGTAAFLAALTRGRPDARVAPAC
jgi:hypothetical protein